jgi:tripartite-type tricarboxylate transporter receptor subunit TctC
MKLARRSFLQLAGGAAALSAGAPLAWSQAYPARPLRLILGYGPGAAPDIVARLIGQWLSERLAQPLVIENRL